MLMDPGASHCAPYMETRGKGRPVLRSLTTHVAERPKHEPMTKALATESPLTPGLILFHGLKGVIFKKKFDYFVMARSAFLRRRKISVRAGQTRER